MDDKGARKENCAWRIANQPIIGRDQLAVFLFRQREYRQSKNPARVAVAIARARLTWGRKGKNCGGVLMMSAC